MRKRHYKILLRTAIVVLPMVVLLGVLAYLKLTGFESALEELVYVKTQGKYALTVDDSSLDLPSFTLTLKDLSIRRNIAYDSGSIRAVKIPFLEIQFGSLLTMLKVKQYDIKHLLIEEPIIEAEASPSETRSGENNIHITQQLLKLYPAVESLLSRFAIETLEIKRAALKVENVSDAVLELKLIDLLVEHWNMRHLTDQSHLRLAVDGQQLFFDKTTLRFSGLTYDFPEHHLRFSNFNFLSQDTLSFSQIEVSGKALTLKNLDYEDLYYNQRYTLQKAEVIDPLVVIHLKLKPKGGRHRDSQDQDPITQIIKQNLGECSIDSTIIRNAQVQLTLQQDQDSVQIDLPHVNFLLHAFKVAKDDDNFEAGGIEIDLNQTAITLASDLTLQCSSVLFDNNRDLEMTEVSLYDSTNHQRLGTCEKLNVKGFNILDLMLQKRFYANSIHLENADINLTQKRIRRQPGKQGIPAAQMNNIVVNDVSLQNIALTYRDTNGLYAVAGLSGTVGNLRRDTAGYFRYDIQTVAFQKAHTQKYDGTLTSSMQRGAFDGRKLQLEEANLDIDSMHVKVLNLNAVRAVRNPFSKEFKNWASVSMKRLDITGNLPNQAKKNHEKENHWPMLTVTRLAVARLSFAIANKTDTATVAGTQVAVKDVKARKGDLQCSQLAGDFTGLLWRTPTREVKAAHLHLNYPQTVNIQGLAFTSDETTIRTPRVAMRGLSITHERWLASDMAIYTLAVNQAGENVLQLDSVNLQGFQRKPHTSPTVARLEVFNPTITLAANKPPKKPASKNKHFIPTPTAFVIHPGEIKRTNGDQIAFGQIEGDTRQDKFSCAYITMNEGGRNIKLNHLSARKGELIIDSTLIRPTADWLRNQTVEDDRITASLYDIHVNGFVFNDLWKDQSIHNADVTINRFNLDVYRDKQLPDPPAIEKPNTLEGFLDLPDNIGIDRIIMKNGSLRYTETSDKTHKDGTVIITDIKADARFHHKQYNEMMTLFVNARLYDNGIIDLNYETMTPTTFKLDLSIKNFDLIKLNQVIAPMEPVLIKSGHLKHYKLSVIADERHAVGDATITYDNLHLEIFKRGAPDKKSLGAELLTFLADGLILKNHRENATTSIEQERIRHKSIFNYWVKTSLQGVMYAVAKGKSNKKKRWFWNK